jgi:type I restriction enzyme M protein
MGNIAGTIKSIRDIFRKDPGLSGDAQRIEQLGWMIFLKLFDDKDKEKEILNPKYKSDIPAELQWRNWAEDDEGITGDELINFVNNKLFPTLKNLTVAADDRLGITIRQIFDGTNNYMKSGTTFRQAINKLNEIDFNSSKEHHLFNVIYEEILQGLAAKKDTGEFYTPRAVTQFIVDMINPKLGEKITDPACGTAGFLVCAIEHLKRQVKNIDDRKTLQETVTGSELKPLPFMLSVVNLITHDIEVPQIENGDSLSREYNSIKQKDRVDIIVANPPFGGVVGDGMETNFPLNYRTKESADLFLILFIQLLKDGGRAGIVLPDGSLTGDGVKQRVRQKLLEDCNVHTIVRLPQSVFAPYATVNTNLIFFEKGKPTKEIWFYEHTLPQGAKAYSKTKPIRIEEFELLKVWWENREENEVAWKVPIQTIIDRNYDLDIKNPTSKPLSILNVADAVNNQKLVESKLYNAINDFSEGLNGLNCRDEIASLICHMNKVINAPKAIEQIDAFILNLAVQGKLLPQDPKNEPASELLKRIKAEKAKSGKKEKILPPIKPEEIPFEIPKNWVWCRLGEIIQYTENLDIQKHLPPNTIINYVDIDAIDNQNFVIREAKQKTVSELSTRARRILKSNYIVYSTVRPYLKNIAIVEDEKDNYIGSTGFNVFRTLNVELKYVFYYLLTPFVNNSFKDLMVGFNSPSITNDQFEKSLFPLPPLSEQKRIVVEIEKLFAKTKQLKEHVIANQQATEQLLKALLHQAFEV